MNTISSSLSRGFRLRAMGDSRDKLKHLVPGKLVTEHTQTCKRGVHKCSLCAVQQSWSLYKKPWLRVLLVDGESKLGCSLCAKAGLEGPWANFEQTPTSVLKKHNLERHEKSKGHMTASQDDLCGDKVADRPIKKLKCGMPSRKQFVLATGLCWQSLAASH